jgi:hypothetical protein
MKRKPLDFLRGSPFALPMDFWWLTTIFYSLLPALNTLCQISGFCEPPNFQQQKNMDWILCKTLFLPEKCILFQSKLLVLKNLYIVSQNASCTRALKRAKCAPCLSFNNHNPLFLYSSWVCSRNNFGVVCI